MHKMTYAIKGDSLVHVSNVPSGLACKCFCPFCGEALIAKKGDRKAHHFAHYNSNECNFGFETSLHLLAKEILSKTKSLMIPAVYVKDKNPDWRVSSEQAISIDSVSLEKRIDNMIPDIIVTSKGRELLVEIYVTHAIDEEKKQKIKSLGLSCLEIDLSHVSSEISKELLAHLLTHECSNSRWIFNAHADAYCQIYTKSLQKITLKPHGLALHAMNCPQRLRVWKEIPYANVIDDCSCCGYYSHIEYNSYGESEFLYCAGKAHIHSLDSLRHYMSRKAGVN